MICGPMVSTPRRGSSCLLRFAATLYAVRGFSVAPVIGRRGVPRRLILLAAQVNDEDVTSLSAPTTDRTSDESWISLRGGDDDAVMIRSIGEVPSSTGLDRSQHEDGTKISISYQGTIADLGWDSSQTVIECWLQEQQGFVDNVSVAEQFLANDVTGAMLLDSQADAAAWTEDFVTDELGVTNKIQCKKLVMAARRLAKDYATYPPGTVFDNAELYSFTLGKSRMIPAMKLAARQHFHKGDQLELLCRSDYAYGKEGLRTMKGDVMVPPFATLCFKINVIDVTAPE